MSASLKSELKAFEKEFKAQHGRQPTKDDIKARPEIDAKYRSYRSRQSHTPVPEPVKAPAPQPPVASTSHVAPAPPVTPKKTSVSPVQPDGTPSLPNLSPSKARTAAIFSTRSPAGKAANPFASAFKDTPRTSARRYLSGAMPTPEKKRNLFSTWKDTQAMTAKPASASDSSLNLPDVNVFRAPSLEPSSASASASTSSKPPSASSFFDLTRSKRAASSLAAFDSERKRSTSVGSGVESDGDLAQDEHQAKKPKLSKKAAAPAKERQKGKGKATKQSGKQSKIHQPDSDVTMDDGQAEPSQPATRMLEDGTMVMSFEDAEGNKQEIRVRDYHPFKNADFDPDDEEPFQRPRASRRPSTEPASSTTSVMDVDASDVPSNLVSLLSIDTSPTKKHRRHVARTKELLYKKVLQEPSLRGSPAAGLLELAQEQEDKSGWTSTVDGGEVGDDEGESSGEDDDWASEPEGWKDLGGEDLTGLDDLQDDSMLL